MSQRIRELDGIRGIAILMVIIWHYITCQPKDLTPGTLLSYLHLPTQSFWTGVDLFFVLSGFLIGGIILDNHSKQSFLKVFWIRRTCRIIPVLSLLLLLCWIIGLLVNRDQYSWLFDELMPWWTYVSFTQNIAMGVSGTLGGHFLDVTWSLAVEEQFYLVAPLLMLAVGRKLWLQALIPLISLALLLRIIFPGVHTYMNTVFRMDALLLGVLVAALYRKPEVWKFLLNNRGVVLSVFVCFLTITGTQLLRGFGVFEYSWFAILYSLFLVVALLYQSSALTRILRAKLLCFWGSIAYGLYMYHQAVAGLLHGWLRNGEAPSLIDGYAAFITALAFLVSTAIAWGSFAYFESIFLKIGRRYKYEMNP